MHSGNFLPFNSFFLVLVGVFTYGTSRKLHEVIPIVTWSILIATRPVLLQVVEDRLARMIVTRVVLLFFSERFNGTASIPAVEFLAITCFHRWLIVCSFGSCFCLRLLLFSVEISGRA